jgi:hypothetical protein
VAVEVYLVELAVLALLVKVMLAVQVLQQVLVLLQEAVEAEVVLVQ